MLDQFVLRQLDLKKTFLFIFIFLQMKQIRSYVLEVLFGEFLFTLLQSQANRFVLICDKLNKLSLCYNISISNSHQQNTHLPPKCIPFK